LNLENFSTLDQTGRSTPKLTNKIKSIVKQGTLKIDFLLKVIKMSVFASPNRNKGKWTLQRLPQNSPFGEILGLTTIEG
jgi:hypothetical protein